jgi:hypothetical protein
MKLSALIIISCILVQESVAFSNGVSVIRQSSTALADAPMGRRDSLGGMVQTLIGAGVVAGAAEYLKDTLKKNADLRLAEAAANSKEDVLVSGLKNAASNGTIFCSMVYG